MDTDKGLAVIGCFGLIPAMIAAIFLKAWALTTLWTWFVFPVFHVPAPSYMACVGISLLLSTAIGGHWPSDNQKDKSQGEIWLGLYSKMLTPYPMAVLMGWLVKAVL